MHTFIFPSKDTYITNLNGLSDRNFGIDELLSIDAISTPIRNISQYQSASVSLTDRSIGNVVNFKGTAFAYLSGSTTNITVPDNSTETVITYGTISGSVNPTNCSCASFNTSKFIGDITGSVSGYVVSAVLNGTTYTTQSINLVNVSGSLTNLSGSVSGSCIQGTLSGSYIGVSSMFTGSLNGYSGELTGDISGSYVYYNPRISFKSYTKYSRAMIKFDVSAISSSISVGDIVDPKFVLNLRVLQQSEVPFDYKVYAYPISQSWEMGDGRFADNGSPRGVSWLYRDESGGTEWYDIFPTTDVYNYLENESNQQYAFSNGGGTWYYSVPTSSLIPTSSFCSTLYTGSSLIMSQSFSYEQSDIKMDVTPIVKSWICGCIPNEGFILLTSEELTTYESTNSKLGFYSKETNTIYTPFLDVVYDDSEFVTGSLLPVTNDTQLTVVLKNVKREYKSDSFARINLFARERFTLKNFVKGTQQSQHLTPKYLPPETYYSVKDTETEEVLIDFDDGTKVSCDSNGNYFMLDMSGLPQERYFKILIKTEINGSVEVFDNNTYFKVVR